MKIRSNIAYVHSGEWPSQSPSTTFATYTVIGLSEVFKNCYFFIKRNSDKTSSEIIENYFYTQKPKNLTIQQIDKALFESNSLFFRKLYKIIVRKIKVGEIDVIVSRHVKFLPYLAEIKKKYQIPAFFESHDFYADLSLRDDINIKKKKRQSYLENKYIPKISGLICLQYSQKKIYQKHFPKIPIQVARTGISKFHYNSNFEVKKYITYIGSLDSLKGVDFLIKSLQFTEAKPELLIIGGKDKQEIDRIKVLAEMHYQKDKVKITGWINKKEMQDYMKMTKIGIIPLRKTFFNQYITSPLKLFDYYSYGIPVIASDFPTTRELIEENKTGLFFEADSQRSLVTKIDSLISDDKKINQMKSYIFESCSKYLWTERAKKFYNFFNERENCYEE